MSKIPYCLPSDISPEQFLTEYWQKKPLLIKNGLPALVGMFEPDDILTLAQDEDATARLISQQNGQWLLKNSPLSQQDFTNLPKHWTVLVQNMEQWSPELAKLWHAFDFIPQWQRDDIMVSYAPEGGGVGKHYDNYDVFLAQGYGSRHWQLGDYCDENTKFQQGQPIRIMDDMGELIFDAVLNVGDVLYVPTNLSHYGVAVDDCLTFSFGCRRPNPLQLLDNITDVATHFDKLSIPLKIAQPRTPAGELHAESIQDIKQQLINLLNSDTGDTLIRQAIAETVSKRQYDLMLAEEVLTIGELSDALAQGATISQDLASRMIFVKQNTQKDTQIQLFINGECVCDDDIDSQAQAVLVRLANGESLGLTDLEKANVDIDSVCEWLENGWVTVDVDDVNIDEPR
ncbi:JmjC domain-containing protein [Moraxella boevrei]|uniref:JmjC domain-containing protein n=1 Tax=Faucicola boevrei TaxID=346665 RepID=UPI00373709BA